MKIRVIRYLLSCCCLVILGLTLSGCSTGSESASNELDLTGIWIYQGPTTTDPTYYLELNLEENKEFILTVNNNILSDTDQEEHTAIIKGNYTDKDSELILKIDDINGSNELILTDDDKYTLGYELSGDSELLTITDIGEYLNGLPDSIELERGNANS